MNLIDNHKKIVFIGHVDTGKSTLCGHLLYKIGHIDDHTMKQIELRADKDKMGKWKYARILDIFEEEMTRGKTHDFNEIELNYKQKKIILVDTPGHQSFVRSMINGISRNINTAILLTSMIENEFESSFDRGMLKEHIILARCIGIENLIIIANKMDVIDWNQEIMNNRLKPLFNFLKKKVGWNSNNIIIVPLSAWNGINLINSDNVPEWYTGKPLIEYLIEDNNKINKKINNISENIQESDTFIINFKLLNTPNDNVFTIGIKSALHMTQEDEGLEIQCEILKLKTKKFLKEMDTDMIKIKTEYKINTKINQRIILRSQEQTLGFGIITKIL